MSVGAGIGGGVGTGFTGGGALTSQEGQAPVLPEGAAVRITRVGERWRDRNGRVLQLQVKPAEASGGGIRGVSAGITGGGVKWLQERECRD